MSQETKDYNDVTAQYLSDIMTNNNVRIVVAIGIENSGVPVLVNHPNVSQEDVIVFLSQIVEEMKSKRKNVN